MDTNLNNYVSVKEVVDGLMQYPSMRDLSYESAVRWSVDVMGLVGSYDLYKDDRETIVIENHRGRLPNGIIRIEQCRKIFGSETGNVQYDPMQYATDVFQTSYNKYPSEYTKKTQMYTWKNQGDWIYTSFDRGLIEVGFKTLYTDDDGIIMLPTNTSLYKAILAYIKQEHFRGLYEIDKISKAVFEEAKTEYCWYIAQAQNSVMNVSLDERQAISNAAHRLMWNDDFQQDAFRNLGDKEYLRNRR
jgi:hypothetical protein